MSHATNSMICQRQLPETETLSVALHATFSFTTEGISFHTVVFKHKTVIINNKYF